MNLDRFDMTVPGKWVLAGEHSVLRGGVAIALPHPDFRLRIEYQPAGQLVIQPESIAREVVQLLERLETLTERSFVADLKGSLTLKSSIPLRAGLGSSAAVSVALTHWAIAAGWVEPANLLRVATQLEDVFHGESSGMDVAVVAGQKMIEFVRGSTPQVLTMPDPFPRFTFHDTCTRASTRDCVRQVEGLDPSILAESDRMMAKSVESARRGMEIYGPQKTKALQHLRHSMDLSYDCFTRWGLLTPAIERQALELKEQGAMAVRLTGAGRGGFLVALWDV